MKCAQVLVLGMLLGTAAEAAEESAASGGTSITVRFPIAGPAISHK